MKTIQIDKWGTWINVEDHGCATETEMLDYIASNAGSFRVADEDRQGEPSGSKMLTASEILTPIYEKADEAGKARLMAGVAAVITALRGDD